MHNKKVRTTIRNQSNWCAGNLVVIPIEKTKLSHIVNVSSVAGCIGFSIMSAFALEGLRNLWLMNSNNLDLELSLVN